MSELTPAWRAWGRALTAIAAVTFALGTILGTLDALNITTPEPSFAPGAVLPDRILTVLQNQSQRFWWVFVATLLAAVSFAVLAALAPVLRRMLGATDPRGWLVSGAFAMGGAIGVVAEIAFIGGQAVASDATYCDCQFADAQLIARGGVLDLVSSVQSWLVYGAIVLFGVGLLAAASLARERADVPRRWTLLTVWLGGLLLVIAVLGAGFPPLAHWLGWEVDPNLVTGVPSLLVLLVLVPWWALWLRSALGTDPAPA